MIIPKPNVSPIKTVNRFLLSPNDKKPDEKHNDKTNNEIKSIG